MTADTVATSQMAAVAVHSASDTRTSTSSVQMNVVNTATSTATANATASTSPARLPRSHSQGNPGQTSVRERARPTMASF